MSSFLLILILILLFAFAAFFSLAETAIFSTNRYKIRHMASEGNRRAAQLTEWLDAPEQLLSAILLGSNFANIGAATLSATLVSKWVLDAGLVDIALIADVKFLDIALIAEAVLLTLFCFLFCELGPKAFAARYPDRIALKVVIPVEICMKILSPLTKAGLKVAGFFFKHVKQGGTTEAVPASSDELRAIIASSAGEERTRMLERVMDFSERQVKDAMVPRMEVMALEMGTAFEDVLKMVETTRYTRVPVYRGTLDNVAGVLHGKDLMPYVHSPRAFRISQLLRKPVFIPDTSKMDSAIRMLQKAQTHMGIVVDEHGGVQGIVTVEDLIEQIVGEIQDEHDVEVDAVVAHHDGSKVIDASISVRELNERLSLEIPESNHYVTLAGFLLRESGKLLKEGDDVIWDGHSFRVEEVMGRRIMRVRYAASPPDHEAETAPASQKNSETSS
jgi:putative hemolysin